ncbi:MAG: DUF3306 domain-containing protein [Paracoccaceae bacterium]
MSGEQNFWSRRRAGVEAEAQAEEAALEAEALKVEHEALEDKSDEELLAHFDLPDPDTLKEGDDFSAFMSKAIPDRLRRRALRVLWRSNPVLANVDMLVDYGEDFTDKALAVENLQTAYQVGKGMLKHVEEMARQAAEKETAEAEGDLVAENEGEEIEETVEEDVTDIQLAAASEEELTQHYFEEESEDMAEAAYVPPTPRRMKFRSGEHA